MKADGDDDENRLTQELHRGTCATESLQNAGSGQAAVHFSSVNCLLLAPRPPISPSLSQGTLFLSSSLACPLWKGVYVVAIR